MRKRKLLAVIMGALCIAAAIPSASALADGQKVVTLGADLSEEQRQAILRYFGVSGQNILTLIITNQDERDHLGSYVPLEQIGTHTYSCSLVNPTNSGGIQVKTANLTWVTSNMIATTLSTSGVVNCEVLAASPFEVSGTGALTGILMAYESAVGVQLDSTKKEVATQELITTTTIADNIGQAEATDIVNETKMQVVQGNVVNDNDIDVIITEVAEKEEISLSEEDRELLKELLQQIAEQDYEYADMKETLERVESNMDSLMEQQDSQTEAPADVVISTDVPATEAPAQTETETPETLAPDSILSNTDDSALGDSVTFDATDDSALTQTEAPAQTETVPGEIDIFNTDEYTENPAPEPTEQTETTTDANVEVIPETAQTEQTEPPTDANVEVIPETVPSEVQEPQASAQTTEPQELPDNSGEAEMPEDEYGIDTMMPEQGDPMFEVPEGSTDATASILTAITPEEMDLAPLYEEESAELLPAGINELTLSFQRDDILAGTGSISLMNAADNSVIETIQANDTEKVSIRPLDEEELAGLGWSGGCQASILLKDPLATNSSYYVTMTENAFTSADGTACTAPIEDNLTWTIQTAEYGFCIDKTNLTAGSSVSGQIMMDNTAATVAYIESADPAMISFDMGEFTASGTFTATLNAAGKTNFQVSFYDEAGTQLYTIDYELEIQ